jgi:hypothetical protein
LATGICTAAQNDRAINYWPLKSGCNWTIIAPDVKSDWAISISVSSSTTTPAGISNVAVDYTLNGKTIQKEVYQVTADEIARIKGGAEASGTVDPPLPIIKLPMKSGQSWKWNGTITVGATKVNATSQFTVTGPFLVSTPAGKFSAMKVHSALIINPGPKAVSMPNDSWYSSGIGLVKQKVTMNGKVHRYFLSKYTVK